MARRNGLLGRLATLSAGSALILQAGCAVNRHSPPDKARDRRIRRRWLQVEQLEARQMLAAIPPDPPGQTVTTTVFDQITPVAIPTGPALVTSTLDVSGVDTYLLDLNLTTFLAHTFAADLDVTIMSPAGTIVTLTTDNGAGNDNVFNGTIWDDGANPGGQVPYVTNNGLVTDQAYVNLTLASPLVPEEALGAFVGEDPNGTWTITISDDLAGDGGSLDSWSLEVSTIPAAPVTELFTFTNNTPTAIPTGPAVVTSTFNVAGTGNYLFDLNLTTFLTHTFAADLDVTIMSPAGTVVTLTTDNGAGNDNVFNGTLWDDDANPAGQVPYVTNDGVTTDHAYVNLTLASPLVPEEALAAFIGENPNGIWTITISDDLAGDGGTLNSWTLDLITDPPPLDFGDAPDPTYPTLLANNGARHVIGGALFLGAAVDDELDGQPTAAADGDDLDATDDEDGVVLPATVIARVAAEATVTSSAAGLLDAWIDFNRNGTFDAAEQIATNLAVVAGPNEVLFVVPDTAVAGASYARFRVSSLGGLGPAGVAGDGEVEDYTVTIAVPAAGSVAVVPDPANPGQNLLLVNGTAAGEAILVQPVPGQPGQIRVLINGTIFGPFPINSFSRIEVFGNQGNDVIVVDLSITLPTTLHGNDGNDTITGGSGPDIIYGDAGDDTLIGGFGTDLLLGGTGADNLFGGFGRDVLIGGLGVDWLRGEIDDDLLIGGTTAHDANVAALEAIRAEWSSANSFNVRVANLAALLNPGTVFDDGVADFLLGSTGRDWMLDFALRDLFLDFDPNPITGDRKN